MRNDLEQHIIELARKIDELTPSEFIVPLSDNMIRCLIKFDEVDMKHNLNTGNDVAKFMQACGQLDDGVADSPEQSRLYMKLVCEEFNELMQAWVDEDIVGIADGIGDLIWVLEGLAWSKGIPLQAVWDEIARSNMSKIMPDGKVHKRADGKVQKPDTFSRADIAGVLLQYENQKLSIG